MTTSNLSSASGAAMGGAGGLANLKLVFRRYKIIALLIAIAIIWGFFSFMTDGGFLTPRNLSNLLRQMSVTGILACGMVLVIIAGEIDLSVGSLLGLLGGIAALLDVSHHLPLALNLVLALGFGLGLGLLNGYLTAYLGIPSFIVGLGGMLAFRGILLGITGGLTIAPVSDNMVYLGQGYLPPQIGVALGIALFVLAVALTWMSRVNRSRHGLPLAALWRDGLKVLVIGAVLLAFVRTLNSYDGIPVPVLLLLGLLGLFSYVSTQHLFGGQQHGSHPPVGRERAGRQAVGVRHHGPDVRAGRSGQYRPPGCRLAVGGQHGRTRCDCSLLHRRHLHARRLRHHLWRAHRCTGDGQPRQRHVHAGRGHLLADDRQGQHPGAGGVG